MCTTLGSSLMARYFDVHPDNPQPRTIGRVVDLLRADGLVAYPTDSCFALGCQLDNRSGLERIREIRQLDNRHHFTLVCADFTQLGRFVQLDNVIFAPSRRRRRGSTPSSCRQPGRFPDECCIPGGVRSGFAFLITWSLRRSWPG